MTVAGGLADRGVSDRGVSHPDVASHHGAGPAATTDSADREPVTPALRSRAVNGGEAPHHLARTSLLVVAVISCGLALHLTVLSGLQHRSAQRSAFDRLRLELAQGTAPVGQKDQKGRTLTSGTPIAILDIPSIRVRQVVVQGTTGTALMVGPGHRRDSPMPGQAGTSVIFGRQASYGGPFGPLHQLRKGVRITITSGQGASTFVVTGLRRAGDPGVAPLPSGHGRLLLVTATGTPFVPSGVLRVDADLLSPTLPAAASVIGGRDLGATEQILATDTSALWALILWLEVLIAAAAAISWSWINWGHHQTWIVFLPVTALVGTFASNQFMRLIPNLL
jgi:sortase A